MYPIEGLHAEPTKALIPINVVIHHVFTFTVYKAEYIMSFILENNGVE